MIGPVVMRERPGKGARGAFCIQPLVTAPPAVSASVLDSCASGLARRAARLQKHPQSTPTSSDAQHPVAAKIVNRARASPLSSCSNGRSRHAQIPYHPAARFAMAMGNMVSRGIERAYAHGKFGHAQGRQAASQSRCRHNLPARGARPRPPQREVPHRACALHLGQRQAARRIRLPLCGPKWRSHWVGIGG